ncbi:hypothetical protein WJ15_25555 [Burkholderia cepacia]|nr:hypothetical protein WJ15_25555 [Burkholderia cepacia]
MRAAAKTCGRAEAKWRKVRFDALCTLDDVSCMRDDERQSTHRGSRSPRRLRLLRTLRETHAS